jgi:hypothetical protein
MVNSHRPMTHRKQRGLSDEQAINMLNEYNYTDTTYGKLAKKYGISSHSISRLVNNITYSDVPGIDGARRLAQAKAARLSKRYSDAKAARVPEAGKTLIEVDLISVESIKSNIFYLQAVLSLLLESARVTSVSASNTAEVVLR